ncbi:hypothetical protein JHK87_009540 [Glycine soja]|nr:hypothetical protein JHK87_009540 [Glycine soja]
MTLGECCSCGSCATERCVKYGKSSIADDLSAIKGPWAIIYWQVTPSGGAFIVFCRIVRGFFSLAEMHLVGGASLFIG